MNAIVRMFEGKDLVVPGELIRQIGVQPGERILIRPAPRLKPKDFSPEERARRLRVLDALWGSWTDEDEEAFECERQEMWSSWLSHNLQ